ncbi:response regulator [Synoicihabitans lomoniglobus]|uniref:Response regulator n=1 Tax=Synoicihabitans lomoniglobus TaxID=2909285 RepID=A0AAF0CIB7_9BACT|nr:response regulator [Opitutaceae bacterium LMO-M01]
MDRCAQPEDAVRWSATARTVLVAEDEPNMRRILVQLLERRGFNVLSFPDGEAAWQGYQSAHIRIDVVVTDLQMPRLDGRGLIARLMRVTPTPQIAVCSGCDEECAWVRARWGTSVATVHKPYSADQLFGILGPSRRCDQPPESTRAAPAQPAP